MEGLLIKRMSYVHAAAFSFSFCPCAGVLHIAIKVLFLVQDEESVCEMYSFV